MLSIIIPTFNAPGDLAQAIDSVLSQTSANWEIIVCPDDGKDYSYLKAIDSRIQVVETELIATGPGPARNRGLPYIKGTAIAYLDSDDQLSNTYVESALTALESVPAIVFPTTYITDTGATICTISDAFNTMTIEQFSKELGSLHVVAKKEYFPKWQECFAEDVLHTCQVIKQLGNTINVIQSACYIAIVRAQSACTTAKNINTEYQRLIDTMDADIGELFAYRKVVNSLYELSDKSKNYHEYVLQLK